ncbi:sensor domain-containing protein [Methylomicrobium sp. RS1]|uniref:sensor domain-containing protein n=1 Tax=Candidatus Methylomicrobium oryzae TaxID=2802053 RepID=UPI001923F389|nr:EAL domain-containing protein [Methylomicrobium sp. RS1]MBL1263743.1 EAL domain-containing protein [Methylomicrobium sp. RS1]
MIQIITPSLYVLSGLCIYAGLIHFSVGFSRPFNSAQIAFGSASLAVSLVALFECQSLKAENLDECITALKWSLGLSIVFFIIFLWFIALFSKSRPLRFLKGLTLLYVLLLWVNVSQPFGLLYDRLDGFKTVHSRWGEAVTLVVGQPGRWFYFALVTVMANFGYVLYALSDFYRHSGHRNLLGMIVAVGFFMMFLIEGLLVRLFAIDFVPLRSYGYLGLMIAMSLILNREYSQHLKENEEKLRGLYELSPLGIALTDMKGRFIEFNEAFRRICGYSADELKNLDYWALTPQEYESQEAEQLESLLRVGYYGPYEKEYRNKSGQRIPLRLNGMLVSGPHGQRYIWSIMEDISKWRQALKALSESEERYRLIVETSNEGICSIDKRFRIVFVNSAMALMLGYAPEQMLGRLLEEFVFEADIPHFRREMQQRSRGESTYYELRLRRRDGKIRWCSIAGSALTDSDGSFAGAFAMFTDITDRRLAAEEMELAALVYQASSQAMMVTDADNLIITVNPAFTEITGYGFEEVLGKQPNFLFSVSHDGTSAREMDWSISTSGKWQGEVWSRRKGGEIYPARLIADTICRDEGSTYRRVALFSDITEEKKSEELIWRQANFDFLTNLPNRRMVHDRLMEEIKRARRDNKRFAVLLIDLDRFKDVNDTLGHEVGDSLLQEAAERMTECVRESDITGRLGGDEFIIVLDDLQDVGNVGRVANGLLDKLAMPYRLKNELAYVSASIGITFYPDDARDITTLLKNADQAMYAAKRQGRNRFHYYTPAMQEESSARMRLTNDLYSALANDQFILHYQPIVDLETGAIHKAEALIRWQHPQRGLVSPSDFIPIAEDTGQIIGIGNWVCRQAAAQVARWRAIHHPAFQVSVNMSPAQFRANADSRIPCFNALAEADLSGQSLVVEITENLLMEAREEISSQLLVFRDMGIQVALDDFGTGYSSLSYLKKFDIDYLKIDQSFVRNLAAGASDLALCEAMIGMAHKLGIQVIAEGIETQDQYEILKEMGCDYGQGYFFSKPLPADRFDALLAKHSALRPAVSEVTLS